MGNEISEILRYSRGWGKIGIHTCICRVEKIMGIRKFHRFSVKITDEIHQNPEKIPEGSNFLGVILSGSPIMCLDIENEYESIEEFHRILDKNSVKMSDLFGETTMNGGLHLYFRIPMDKKSKNQYKKVNKNVHFDLLFNGKSFTVPSFFNEKKYTTFDRSIFDLESIEEIPEFPEFLSFMLYDNLDI